MSRGEDGGKRGSDAPNADFGADCCNVAHNREQSRPLDPALARLVEAWATLPEAVRVGILALIEASARG